MSVVLAVVLALLSVTSPIVGFNCSHAPSCSCSLHGSITYLKCKKMNVSIELHKSVTIMCGNYPVDVSILSNLQIGNVEELTLIMCYKPDISIKQLMTSMTLNQIKSLDIDHPFQYTMEVNLTKKYFESLFEVTNLTIRGPAVFAEDVFEDMTNLISLRIIYRSEREKYLFSFRAILKNAKLRLNKKASSLVPGMLKNLTRLRLLDIWIHREHLNRSVFSDVKNLECLNLYSNDMSNMNPDLFVDLENLKMLNLYAPGFKLIILPPGLLSNNKQLQEFKITSYSASPGIELIIPPLQLIIPAGLPNNQQLPEFNISSYGSGKISISLSQGSFSNLLELKMVTLAECGLRSLPADVFKGSRNILTLNLRSNKLTTLEEQTFKGHEALELIDLSYNNISTLPEGLFSETLNLKTLLLFHNQIKYIHNGLFLELKSLEYLDLKFNQMEKIEGGQFSNLISLKTLNISYNFLTSLQLRNTSFGSKSVFSACKDLEDLQLANNSLTEIFEDWRIHLKKLKVINMSLNSIVTIDINSLDFISEATIDLSQNSITLVDFRQYTTLASKVDHSSTSKRNRNIRTKTLKIDNNPLNCNCTLLDFVLFVQRKLPPKLQDLFRIDSSAMKCHEPAYLEGVRLQSLRLSLLNCSTCPKQCSCDFNPLQKAFIIDCKIASFTHILESFDSFKYGSDHTVLRLEGYHLHNFKIPQKRGYANITQFYLSNNSIHTMDFTGFSSKLKVLDLSYNLLTSLSEEAVSFLRTAPNLTELSLHGNSWECDCKALPLTRLIQERFKEVLYPNNITCADSGIPLVDMREINLCPERIMLVIIIACSVLMITILGLTVLYYKYKRQIQIYCFSSRWRVVRWMVSHPDLDENKIYDAFMSFANEDEDFVAEHLVPALEENGKPKYKLCLHYRDWVAGELIPSQIFNSVKNSRRTIVVLSPNFLRSVWGKLEFKTAHAEGLKEGTAKVIVILYQDVGDVNDLDEELKAYLQMNTYVKWDSPWFWHQLKYALPHLPGRTDEIQCGFGCFPNTNRVSRAHNIIHEGRVEDGKQGGTAESPEKTSENQSEEIELSKRKSASLHSIAENINQNGTAKSKVKKK